MWMIDEFTLHTHFLYGFSNIKQINLLSCRTTINSLNHFDGGCTHTEVEIFSAFSRKFYIYFMLLTYSPFVYSETRRADAIRLCYWMYACRSIWVNVETLSGWRWAKSCCDANAFHVCYKHLMFFSSCL